MANKQRKALTIILAENGVFVEGELLWVVINIEAGQKTTYYLTRSCRSVSKNIKRKKGVRSALQSQMARNEKWRKFAGNNNFSKKANANNKSEC